MRKLLKEIIKAELYKFYKKKYLVSLLCLNLLPLLYGMGAYFKWKIVLIGAKLDLITFATSMWSFTVMLTIPLILLLFIAATTLGGEINEGQMLLEVTRIEHKKTLIVGKALAILIMCMLFYITNIICSICTYIVFLSRTDKGYSSIFVTHNYNLESIFVSIASLLFICFLLMTTFYLSMNSGVIVATLSGMGIYLLCMLLAYIPGVSEFIPGYFTVVANYKFTSSRVIFQYVELSFLCSSLIFLTVKQFEKKKY